MNNRKYNTIDLFAGAGGLSLGFDQTGRFDIKVAYENNPTMQQTYKKNHSETVVFDDVCRANYKKLKKKYGQFDVVIGGPPCQGFSNANRQKSKAISQNNMLVKQFIRAILELQPKCFVMENVSMLKSDVHRFYMSYSDIKIVKKYEIPTKDTMFELLDENHYFEAAFDIVSSEKKLCECKWDDHCYSIFNIVYKSAKNKKLSITLKKHEKELKKIISSEIYKTGYNEIDIANEKAYCAISRCMRNDIESPESFIVGELEQAISIQNMLNKAKEIYDNDIVVKSFDTVCGLTAHIDSFAVFDYIKAILQSEKNGYTITSGILCAADYGVPQKRMRFVVMGIKKEISQEIQLPDKLIKSEEYHTIRDAIEDIEQIDPVYNLQDDTGLLINEYDNNRPLSNLRDSKRLFNHIITKTTDVALERFMALKPGQNFHDLDESMKSNTYTDITRTQNTIYSRLAYDEPSATVLNVRKSMWIHPVKNRAISVREAARLQSFPDSFVFCGTKDKQYQQVGNAVPPMMANQIAKSLLKLLDTKTE